MRFAKSEGLKVYVERNKGSIDPSADGRDAGIRDSRVLRAGRQVAAHEPVGSESRVKVSRLDGIGGHEQLSMTVSHRNFETAKKLRFNPAPQYWMPQTSASDASPRSRSRLDRQYERTHLLQERNAVVQARRCLRRGVRRARRQQRRRLEARINGGDSMAITAADGTKLITQAPSPSCSTMVPSTC